MQDKFSVIALNIIVHRPGMPGHLRYHTQYTTCLVLGATLSLVSRPLGNNVFVRVALLSRFVTSFGLEELSVTGIRLSRSL